MGSNPINHSQRLLASLGPPHPDPSVALPIQDENGIRRYLKVLVFQGILRYFKVFQERMELSLGRLKVQRRNTEAIRAIEMDGLHASAKIGWRG